MQRLDFVEAKMFTSYLFVMILAWMANLAGLATIIGAFAAGVVLHDSYFHRSHRSRLGRIITIRQLIMPLEVILVPIFFILIGIQVKIETFVSIPVATVALGLLVAAILGKLACGEQTRYRYRHGAAGRSRPGFRCDRPHARRYRRFDVRGGRADGHHYVPDCAALAQGRRRQ